MPSRTPVETIPVEALLADFPPSHTVIAERLRRVVLDAVPDAIERVRPGWRLIGYDIPIKRRRAFFAWIWLQPEHVHLGFQRGVDMEDPDGILEGAGVTKLVRWLTYEPGGDVNQEQAAQFVLEAARVALIPRSAR